METRQGRPPLLPSSPRSQVLTPRPRDGNSVKVGPRPLSSPNPATSREPHLRSPTSPVPLGTDPVSRTLDERLSGRSRTFRVFYVLPYAPSPFTGPHSPRREVTESHFLPLLTVPEYFLPRTSRRTCKVPLNQVGLPVLYWKVLYHCVSYTLLGRPLSPTTVLVRVSGVTHRSVPASCRSRHSYRSSTFEYPNLYLNRVPLRLVPRSTRITYRKTQ